MILFFFPNITMCFERELHGFVICLPKNCGERINVAQRQCTVPVCWHSIKDLHGILSGKATTLAIDAELQFLFFSNISFLPTCLHCSQPFPSAVSVLTLWFLLKVFLLYLSLMTFSPSMFSAPYVSSWTVCLVVSVSGNSSWIWWNINLVPQNFYIKTLKNDPSDGKH